MRDFAGRVVRDSRGLREKGGRSMTWTGSNMFSCRFYDAHVQHFACCARECDANPISLLQAELAAILKDYVGRESPLYHAERLSEAYARPDGSRAEIYFKREDLNHTGAHKINNSLGQALLCKRMGKKRVIAETGAGQHGVATATVCARFGLQCIVYMGAKDMKRQALNVFRMRLLGAEVCIDLPCGPFVPYLPIYLST